jgi:hypothetical protein
MEQFDGSAEILLAIAQIAAYAKVDEHVLSKVW